MGKATSPFGSAGLALLALSATATAQEVETSPAQIDAALASVRWSRDDAGRVRMTPHPSGAKTPEPACDVLQADTWRELGVGVFALLAHGRSDFASLADATTFFERIGEPLDEGAVLDTICREPAARRPEQPIDRVLAIRIAQERRLESALDPIREIARTLRTGLGDWPAHRAAVEALLDLTGGNPGQGIPPSSSMPPLSERLLSMPSGTSILVQIDQTRLPSARRFLLALGRELARAARARLVEQDHPPTSSEIASIARASALPNLLPYELAREFGNHRIMRTLLAVTVDGTFEVTDFEGSFEGGLALGDWIAGARKNAANFEPDADSPLGRGQLDNGLRIDANFDRFRIALGTTEREPVTDEQLARLTGSQPIRIALLRPDTLPPLPGFPWPETIGIDIPIDSKQPATVELTTGAPAVTETIEQSIRHLTGLAEQRLDDDPLVAWTTSFAVHAEGTSVRITIPRDGIDSITMTIELLAKLGYVGG